MLFIGWSKFLSRHYQSEALPRCGIHTSSVWNFCARSSDVIRRETNGGSTKCRLFSSGYDWSSGGQKLIFFKIWEKKIVTVTFGRQIFCIWNLEVAKTTVRCCGCKIPVIQKVVVFFKSTGQDVKPAAEDIQQAVMARVLLYCWKPATGIAWNGQQPTESPDTLGRVCRVSWALETGQWCEATVLLCWAVFIMIVWECRSSHLSDLSRCYFPLGRGALKTWKAMVVEIKWDFFPLSKWKL